MKKVFSGIVCMALVLCMIFTLASCGDKAESIKKAFEEKGYKVETVDTNNDTAKGIMKIFLSDDQIEKVGEYELILCTNGIVNTAIIIKFPAESDVKDFLTVEKDGEKNTSAYDAAKENGTLNGNCLIFTVSSEAKEIFKKA